MSKLEEFISTKLNSEQFSVATSDSREILTLACAGSGKSRTLAYRIAWLVAEKNADPASIVAFTFTEKAADSLKIRIAEALTECGLDINFLGRMYIGTIHSYCQYLLGEFDAKYRQFDVLDDNKLKLFLVENYPHLHLHVLRGRAAGERYFETISQAASAWVTANEEILNPEDILARDEEIGTFIVNLKGMMLEKQFIDFSLMQRLVVDCLVLGEAEGALQNIKHLLVDEYQDINPIQDKLIAELHKRGETLIVVGDDDQSIYGWRGADVTRIQDFHSRFNEAERHTIGTNYRSTELIVSSANTFADAVLGANRITKTPSAIPSDQPHQFGKLWFDTRDEESSWVVDKILELLGKAYKEDDGRVRGLTPSDIAILMRSTRQPEPNGEPPRHFAYTSKLQELGIPFSLEAGGSLFDRPQVSVMRQAFEMLRDGNPSRDQVIQFFQDHVVQAFPNANLSKLSDVYAKWGREIHAPIGMGQARRRVYPQNLVFELMAAFGVAVTKFDDATLQDMGVFSRIIQDVESVFPSVDSSSRFRNIINFLAVVAEKGYDTSSGEMLKRPNAVTVSTVHKMKGLEFPVVFLVDVEAQRFPKNRSQYSGWIPSVLIAESLQKGAYQSSVEDEARLFYTAITRAERFLYVTGCVSPPGAKRAFKQSMFTAHLGNEQIISDPQTELPDMEEANPEQRLEADILPTSYTDIKYYLRCPKDYQFRKVFGFSPAIPDLFGFGSTTHASIGKLHQLFNDSTPSREQAEEVVDEVFHLKHVLPSNSPIDRPGPYERAQTRAKDLVSNYVEKFSADFSHIRQLEARFEIPAQGAVISGAIDLMLLHDQEGNVIDAYVIDFKTMEGGDDAENNPNLDWTDLALQVQLYAKASSDVLGQNTEAGFVHLLKDGQRIEVPVDQAAIDAALKNVEWAVAGIIRQDFPMRPNAEKCSACDFKKLCSQMHMEFATSDVPPAIHVPSEDGQRMADCFQGD